MFEINSERSPGSNRDQRLILRMAEIEVQCRIGVPSSQDWFALRAVRELDPGGIIGQVLGQDRAQRATRGNVPPAIAFEVETRSARPLVSRERLHDGGGGFGQIERDARYKKFGDSAQ